MPVYRWPACPSLLHHAHLPPTHPPPRHALPAGHLESGLKDHYDVKMPCHLMLSKMAACDAPAVIALLDRLIDPLDKTLTTKLKSDAVKQEVGGWWWWAARQDTDHQAQE